MGICVESFFSLPQWFLPLARQQEGSRGGSGIFPCLDGPLSESRLQNMKQRTVTPEQSQLGHQLKSSLFRPLNGWETKTIDPMFLHCLLAA